MPPLPFSPRLQAFDRYELWVLLGIIWVSFIGTYWPVITHPTLHPISVGFVCFWVFVILLSFAFWSAKRAWTILFWTHIEHYYRWTKIIWPYSEISEISIGPSQNSIRSGRPMLKISRLGYHDLEIPLSVYEPEQLWLAVVVLQNRAPQARVDDSVKQLAPPVDAPPEVR